MALRVDPSTRRGRFALRLAGYLVRMLLGVLGRTWRWRIALGKGIYDELLAAPEASLVTFWHNRSVIAADFVLRRLHRRGVDVTLLASQSRDGELVTSIGRAWGLRVVRGSASRGGRQAMWGMYKAIRAGSSPITIPDGPRGPIYELKEGVIHLAQMTETPLLPLGFAADRAWRIRSWDRILIPKPFARVAVVVGARESVAPKLEGDAREARRLELQELLDDLTRRAEEAVGGSFPN